MASRNPRVLVDSNVFFSGALSPASVPAQVLIAARQDRFRLVICSQVLEEVTRNLRTKAPEVTAAFTQFTLDVATEVVRDGDEEGANRWLELGLYNDAYIIAAALAAEVDYLCSGDRKLREVVNAAELRMKVLTPRELIDMLR